MYKNTLTLCLCRYWPIDTREKRYNFYRQTIQYANGKLIHRLCLLLSMLRGIFECKLSLSWCGLNFKVKDHNFPSIIISGYIQDSKCSFKTVYYAWQVNFHFLTLHMFKAWKEIPITFLLDSNGMFDMRIMLHFRLYFNLQYS